MKKELDMQKTALTVGLFFATVHVIWSVLILIGLAQPLLDLIFWLHMVAPPFKFTEFSLTQSLTVIAVAFAVGYFGGFLFSGIWNKVHKS